MKQRLHKILAESSELSRRAAERCITAGEVMVNNKVVTRLGSTADSEKDVIKWRGRLVRPQRLKTYLIYHKPKSVLVTKSDPQGRKTIWDDLEKFKGTLNAVGRLDYDSEGLLILTNDGGLINRLTHPKHEIKKIYHVKIKGFPSPAALDRLRRGITVEGVEYQPADIKIRRTVEKNTWLGVKIGEGKHRQLRKMFSAIDHPVQKLKRVAIGPIKLTGLAASEWRYLSSREIGGLLVAAGLRPLKRRSRQHRHRVR